MRAGVWSNLPLANGLGDVVRATREHDLEPQWHGAAGVAGQPVSARTGLMCPHLGYRQVLAATVRYCTHAAPSQLYSL